jgi:hypothetical protein
VRQLLAVTVLAKRLRYLVVCKERGLVAADDCDEQRRRPVRRADRDRRVLRASNTANCSMGGHRRVGPAGTPALAKLDMQQATTHQCAAWRGMLCAHWHGRGTPHVLYVVRGTLHVVRHMLHSVCGTSHAGRCVLLYKLYAGRGMLYVTVARCILCVALCTLHVARCILHSDRAIVCYAACSMLHCMCGRRAVRTAGTTHWPAQ